MTDRFRESGGIEPLIDGPVGNTIRLALNQIRIFEVIAVILAVVTLIDELRTAGIIAEDRSNAPSTQNFPRHHVSVFTQLGNGVYGGDRQVITLGGQACRADRKYVG